MDRIDSLLHEFANKFPPVIQKYPESLQTSEPELKDEVKKLKL
jgi:hypothetical protein